MRVLLDYVFLVIGRLQMSNSIRVKCDICKKVRVPGLGVAETICGRFFNIRVEPYVTMCSQCRYKIVMAAMNRGIERYHQLYVRKRR